MRQTGYCFLLLTLVCCRQMPASNGWHRHLDGLGTYSSARTVDLNGDQVPDVVIGAGGKEEVNSDSAVLALDGATGRPLWAIPGINQYVGSAVFQDITHDDTPDVFIGGRWAQLTAINGANGKVIWTFFPERTRPDGSDGGWYNFTTPQFVPDQDGDRLPDLLIANGGDARAAAGDTSRPIGRLLVISSRYGRILANVQVPDGKETYMSVVCDTRADKTVGVIFGTGGETLPGHLYRTSLQDIMQGNISQATVLATGNKKGFVASPVLVDLTGDHINDIVVNAVAGEMIAIDGATDSLLWKVNLPGTEAYTMPATGRFNEDTTPDLYANFAIGVFPVLNYSVRFMVNGKSGQVEYRDTIPAFQYASGVAADLDGDGYDEVIVNQCALKRTQFDRVFYSYLLAFDFKRHQQYSLGDTLTGTNLASTPWIGDLNHDGQYDVLYTAVQYRNALFDLQVPLGLSIRRYSTKKKIYAAPRWGAFMGSGYTGNY